MHYDILFKCLWRCIHGITQFKVNTKALNNLKALLYLINPFLQFLYNTVSISFIQMELTSTTEQQSKDWVRKSKDRSPRLSLPAYRIKLRLYYLFVIFCLIWLLYWRTQPLFSSPSTFLFFAFSWVKQNIIMCVINQSINQSDHAH